MTETSKNSVLIVDDETSNIITLTNMLSGDYNVFAAKNGAAALKAAKELMPDVILLDILMPDMDGYEVISYLKGSEETRGIPVIFITGLDTAEAEEKGLLLGASDYITKPFNTAIVKLRVQNQIQFSSQYNIVRALSLVDELTGLLNSRGFDYRLRLDLNRAKREQSPLSIVLVDIDELKSFNDNYGYEHGDAVIQTTAKIIKQKLKRSIDLPARWGGGKFIALLPDTDVYGAFEVAEQIRKNVEEAHYPADFETKVTVSIGINIYMPDRDANVQDFISGAGNALYAAKRAGGNMVRKYER